MNSSESLAPDGGTAAQSSLKHPALKRLLEQLQQARADGQTLDIRGGHTKRFYGNTAMGQPLDVTPLAGISSYEPSELVVTVRAGTPLAELEAVLADKGQCLPFEPPRLGRAGAGQAPFGAVGGTVGGMVAAGLSGPARAAVGSVRDYVLGATLLTGRGELLSFGGQVMKNVAGYDVARLLAGSLGTLGVICEVSLKVLAQPVAQHTLRFEMDEARAITLLQQLGGQPLPLNASAWWEGMLVVRLAGAGKAVEAAAQLLRQNHGGGDVDADMAATFWQGLRDQTDEFFVGAHEAVARGAQLWRLSVPAWAPPLKLAGQQLIEWGGAQRWLCTPLQASALREAARAAGGHATLFRAAEGTPAPEGGVFAPLSAPLARIQRSLKQSFDPDGLFNRGRLYPDW
ncbi:MAG: glycolate oxidase subunit GlcE [Rubrivivax sp.]|jgi:glycolate oxidase FAD binding subunit|nr:glycolate oxidase subunit GlcE [Rubrivivax sp.]